MSANQGLIAALRSALAELESGGDAVEVVKELRRELSIGVHKGGHVAPCDSCGEVRTWGSARPGAADGRRLCRRCAGIAGGLRFATNDEVLVAFRALADRLGRTPTQRGWDAYAKEHGLPSRWSVKQRFGVTWAEFCAQAGLTPNPTGGQVSGSTPGYAAGKRSANRQMVTGGRGVRPVVRSGAIGPPLAIRVRRKRQ